MTTAAPLEQIKALCQRYAHPGVNVGAHALACKILRIIQLAQNEQTCRAAGMAPGRTYSVDGDTIEPEQPHSANRAIPNAASRSRDKSEVEWF